MRGEASSCKLCPLKASPACQVWVGGLALIPSMSVRMNLRFAPKHGSCRECAEDMRRSQRLAFQQDFGVRSGQQQLLSFGALALLFWVGVPRPFKLHWAMPGAGAACGPWASGEGSLAGADGRADQRG